MKQYLLLCDENAKEDLEKVLYGVTFLEVQGLNVSGTVQLLATPVNEGFDEEQAYISQTIDVPELNTQALEV